ncbi:MAG TPA: hypothetical protein VJY15_23305 [Candidatus Acidoferrum sp.]|nr:hypothetical protein [Candidatus Acidoferrum sp.]
MASFKELKAIVDHLTRPLQDAADALSELSEIFERWVTLQELQFQKDNPHVEISPAFVGVAKYPNPARDKPEEEGEVFPESKRPTENDRWVGIGPRERKAIESEERRARRGLAKSPQGSASPARRKSRAAR